ncbi:formate dehydrogenase subunit delta [Pseudogemmobacter humi]|uniref:NADH-dependent formate dehydrogenase delta subunit FdsD n=1 Tax=Pseudogemmobacter humi TaxID=2483812 RepID=A0A3P5X0W6_9RHOB|nr:formate dehydrogenase subunit delta [Pseudogemmobacter humi]VDC27717.1 NADH-dependent formate dehydrogenase delta subunit FdsD [Pseudogemmobacter humi]
MSAEKIVRMANQISMFMETKPKAEGIEGISSHINDFWEPRMRRQFFELLDSGAAGFRPLVVEAAEKIRRPTAAA